MAQDLFRVEVGFADDNVHYLSGAGAPSGTLATDAPVGSSWQDTSTGDAYTKLTAGWTKQAVGGDMTALQTQVDDLQTEVNAIETGVGLNTDGTYTAPVGTNYLGSTTTVKGGLVALDTATKAASDAAAAVAGDLSTYQTAQDLRDDGQDTLIAGKVSKAGDTMTGNLTFGGTATVTGLAAPTDPTDAATKNYVDNTVAGLTWQAPVNGIGATNPATAATGDRFINTTDDKVYTATAPNTWDAGVTPADGWAAFDKSTETGYVFSGADWVQFTGGGSLTAGVGLTMTGNQIDANLGAGVTQLPSDEIGLDLRASAGLFMTEDGTTPSTATAAQLAVRLDGTSISAGAAGIKVADALTAAISANTSGLAQEILDRTDADGVLQGQIDTLDSDVADLTAEVENWAHRRRTGSTSGGGAPLDLDTVVVEYFGMAHWLLRVRDTVTNRVTAIEVFATHNAYSTVMASTIDYTTYAKLKVGGNLAGLAVSVVLLGATPATQTANLRIATTNVCEVWSIGSLDGL